MKSTVAALLGLAATAAASIELTLMPQFKLAAQTHYGDPYKGACESDEKNVTIQGVPGAVCTPECTGILKTKCPTDVPSGVTAAPQCALKDQSGNKYCALICQPGANDGACGSATCKSISGVGLCTYDD